MHSTLNKLQIKQTEKRKSSCYDRDQLCGTEYISASSTVETSERTSTWINK